MHKILKISYLLVGFLIGFFILKTNVKAVTFTYPEYDVDITINKDSSFTVKETAIYKFYGETHGLRRDLTLADPDRDSRCTTTLNLYCGGFERVVVNKVSDNKGNDITDKVKLFNYTPEDSSTNYMRFEWEIWPNGEELNGDIVGWTLEYTIYGGIANAQNAPYFYWNVLPEDRNGTVDNTKINITFPKNVSLDLDKFLIYSDYQPRVKQVGNTVNLTLQNLPDFGPFTVAYEFEPTDIELPGSISYKISPEFSYSVLLDGIDVTDQADSRVIKAVSKGTHKVKFTHIGYKSQEFDVNVESGKDTYLEVSLEPESWMSILLLLNTLFCFGGCLLMPVALVFVYFYYRARGRDMGMPKTIIPLFTPPKDVNPYLLGSLIDETVDKEDIIGSIIDLAYRGYIKIKELEKNKNYELTKLEGKPKDKGLDEVEQDIMNALFGLGDVIETKNLSTIFPLKIPSINTKIYNLMVNKGFFVRSPRSTIQMYVGMGTALLLIGGVTTVCFTIFIVTLLGTFSVFTLGIVLALMGLAFLIAAKYMPAKTKDGSKVYAEILGFKMYLYTAERYTLQHLQPEDFERYLSYAVVLKIEKEWAEKFKDIYKGSPEWFEGSGDIYDAIWVSSFARSFANSTVTNMTPISTSSSSGSGWSGGGSFGGFSGGGGGGGSSGGW